MDEEQVFTGALLDDRPESEKLLDVKFGEMVGLAAPVDWKEKPESEWRTFPVKNQKKSNGCGAFSWAKLMGIYYWLRYGNFIDFSEEDIYQRRSPHVPGMSISSLYRIAKEGVTLKALTNVDVQVDDDMDNAIIEPFKHDVGKLFAMGDMITVPLDIDTIASIIQTTGKPLHFLTALKVGEYSKFDVYPEGTLNKFAPATNRHFNVFTDFTLKGGVKKLLIDDSAHFGGLSRRLIGEDWLRDRGIMLTYPMNFKFEEGMVQPQPIPSDKFTKPLVFLKWNDANDRPDDMSLYEMQREDVFRLQMILQKLGHFPSNFKLQKNGYYGYYGAMTAKAVYSFQVKYNVAPLSELHDINPIGGRVGNKTIDALNRFV